MNGSCTFNVYEFAVEKGLHFFQYWKISDFFLQSVCHLSSVNELTAFEQTLIVIR